jgi:NADPH2:quinone reductase
MANEAGTMRALGLKDSESPAEIHELPIPELASGEILVRVKAASINPFDAMAAAGYLKDYFEHRFPVVVGKDFAGVVERVADGVTAFAPGDEVVGITPPAMDLDDRGTFAEYVAVPAGGYVAKKPERLSFPEAAALGLAGAAAQAAIDALDPSDGDRLLIVGATGGVGSFATQLAAGRGAHVIATGLPEDEELLRELGASDVVDYSGDVVALVKERYPDGIDALLDLVNRDPGPFGTLADLVRSGGRTASTRVWATRKALRTVGSLRLP